MFVKIKVNLLFLFDHNLVFYTIYFLNLKKAQEFFKK